MCQTQSKPARTIRRTDGGFVIVQDGVSESFSCREVSPMFGGRSFAVAGKVPSGEREFTVTIHAEPRKCFCGCWEFWIGHKCRHVDGLRALLSR